MFPYNVLHNLVPVPVYHEVFLYLSISCYLLMPVEVQTTVVTMVSVIALDSKGIKVANRGEWIRHKWLVRKGYLKIHVAVDIKGKRILSLEVTSEEVHDGKMLSKLVDNASFAAGGNDVKGILADGMYDSNNNFRYLSKNHIKPSIKTRSNSKVRLTNCQARNMPVVRQQANLKRWKRRVNYGYR